MSGVMVLTGLIASSGYPRSGYLFGTTAIAGTPDTPARRRVQIWERDAASPSFFFGARPVDDTMSDAAGAWRIDGLDPQKRYAVLAYDHTGVHDPVIKMNLVPTVD